MNAPINEPTQQREYEHAKLKLMEAYHAVQKLTEENKLKLAQEVVGTQSLKEFLRFFSKQ